VIYADTNILLALFCEDSLTAAAEAWFDRTADTVSISPWTVLEFRSNVGVRIRKVELPRVKGIAAMRRFEAAAATHFHVLAPAPEHFVRAGHWLADPDCALRSGDALHLAIAFGHGCTEFATFDQALGASAKKLKLNVKVLKL
jgi:uncharacterized protein